MRTIIFLLSLASSVVAFDWQKDVHSGDFTSESHPGDDDKIRKFGNLQVSHIQGGNWMAYKDFDFGDGVTYLWVEAASPRSGGSLEFRLGSETGTLIGTLAITETGDWNTYKPFGLKLLKPVSGVQNLYLKCLGNETYHYNLAKFRFQRLAPDYKPPGAITPWIKRTPTLATQAGSFISESHPSDDHQIRSENGNITHIGNENWVEYKAYDFGAGANFVTIQGASKSNGGTVELRIGHPTSGKPIGKVAISGTGDFHNYQPFNADLTKEVAGVQDLYLRFLGDGWAFFNIKDFRFQQLDAVAKSKDRLIPAQQFDQVSKPGVDAISGSDGISSLRGGQLVSYHQVNFGQGVNLVTVMAATPGKGGAVEMWIDTPDGPLQIATINVTYTGSWTHYREYTAATTINVKGTYKLVLKFIDTHQQGGNLFNVKNFVFESQAAPAPSPSNEETLAVYDHVTGLEPSPYYTYSVQKVRELNASQKQNATNWLSPFAWFTECKGYGDPFNTAYYANEIAGWSHTYCNFEMGERTPIVVKITRQSSNPHGAPSGPITMANVHPAHKVKSCEIINGEVYVTMSEPALVTVDIDGQMDTRDAPRSANAEMASSKPYASRQKGSHAVSIFANPVIADKPVIGASGVKVIKPGDPLPKHDDPSWTTLYFDKGVHHFSRNADGSPGIWKNGDAYILMSDKTCYISGDAIIFGNFDGRAEGSQKHRVRVYGHGTISGAQMPHWDDPHWDEPAQAGTNYLDRPIAMSSGYNCRFEGITLADPANHGIAFDHGGGNSRRWIKQVSWRANSDMGGIPGIVEDCFFRLQDDGPYVAGDDFRRNTLWFDCNGSPFRGTFMKRGTYAAGHQAVIEDCDIIYVRSNWGGHVIGAGDYWETGTYSDGTKNTAQHVIFRNIRVTDPRPTRELFGFSVADNDDSGFAGIRFENIEYRFGHSWGARSSLKGTAKAPIHHCYFDRVSIEGEFVDAKLFANPNVFTTENVSNMIFDKPNPQASIRR